jgi:hypothetical protein
VALVSAGIRIAEPSQREDAFPRSGQNHVAWLKRRRGRSISDVNQLLTPHFADDQGGDFQSYDSLAATHPPKQPPSIGITSVTQDGDSLGTVFVNSEQLI